MIDIKQITLSYLKHSSLRNNVETILQEFERAQLTIYNMATSKDEAGLISLRIGTVLTFAILNNMSQGKKPKDFTADEWHKIADIVVDYGINVNAEIYSIMVFETYADYIETSASVIRNRVSKEVFEKINCLAYEIRALSKDLRVGAISEVTYIEESMWICLEAMIKLLEAYATRFACPEIKRFVEGVASYAFEYGRFVLYKKEQELVIGYLEGQEQLNEELREKYEEYIKELQVQAEIFEGILHRAFSDDFRDSLRGSVEMARSVGVAENEILKTVDDVDDFFM